MLVFLCVMFVISVLGSKTIEAKHPSTLINALYVGGVMLLDLAILAAILLVWARG